MKQCPKCEQAYEDSRDICPKCNVALASSQSSGGEYFNIKDHPGITHISGAFVDKTGRRLKSFGISFPAPAIAESSILPNNNKLERFNSKDSGNKAGKIISNSLELKREKYKVDKRRFPVKALGSLLKGVGYVAYFVFGIWGFILSLAIINHAVGFWGSLIAFVIFPVTLVFAPWYALIAYGTWYPLIVIYGGGIFATILAGIGFSIAGE